MRRNTGAGAAIRQAGIHACRWGSVCRSLHRAVLIADTRFPQHCEPMAQSPEGCAIGSIAGVREGPAQRPATRMAPGSMPETSGNARRSPLLWSVRP